jgi:hypothetical protein
MGAGALGSNLGIVCRSMRGHIEVLCPLLSGSFGWLTDRSNEGRAETMRDDNEHRLDTSINQRGRISFATIHAKAAS